MALRAIILLGAPGAGKGTAAERIRDSQGMAHVATGDMLREAIKQGLPLGREADAYMRRGDLVPDELIIKMVEERLAAGGPDGAFLFDGFPRTIRQAELLAAALERLGGRLEHVILLDCPRETLIKRLTGRRICRACGANFHVVNLPPKQEGVCDQCGGELYQRPDDTEATIVSRLDVFATKTRGLIDWYTQKSLLRHVDSSAGPDRLAVDVLRILKGS